MRGLTDHLRYQVLTGSSFEVGILNLVDLCVLLGVINGVGGHITAQHIAHTLPARLRPMALVPQQISSHVPVEHREVGDAGNEALGPQGVDAEVGPRTDDKVHAEQLLSAGVLAHDIVQQNGMSETITSIFSSSPR